MTKVRFGISAWPKSGSLKPFRYVSVNICIKEIDTDIDRESLGTVNRRATEVFYNGSGITIDPNFDTAHKVLYIESAKKL